MVDKKYNIIETMEWVLSVAKDASDGNEVIDILEKADKEKADAFLSMKLKDVLDMSIRNVLRVSSVMKDL